jgi:Ca-activated chloride channel family protein
MTWPTRQAARRGGSLRTKVPKEVSVAVGRFGTRAALLRPPTASSQATRSTRSLQRGTTIGDAIALAIKLATPGRDGIVRRRCSSFRTARDGGQTAPLTAARRARTAHIPVSTVLVGTPNGVVTSKLVGGYEEQSRVPPSPSTLQEIAQLSGGQFFRARTTAALTSVYKKLATRIGHRTESRQITDLFAGGGIILLLVGGGLSTLWFRRPVP